MTVALELLREAYPDGYLAMRGVLTVGEWQCVGDHAETPTWLASGGPRSALDMDWPTGEHTLFPDVGRRSPALQRALVAGDLLPNLDPENDPATWACVKRDLADAAGLDGQGEVTFSGRDGRWALSVINRYNGGQTLNFEVDTDDAATALVVIRTRLRKGTTP